MEPVLFWGLDFIRAVQSVANPALTSVMLAITALGGQALFLILLPILYWCIDEKKGLRLGLMVLISAWVNLTLKHLLDQPRPFFEGFDPSVGMVYESTGGLPSGHAQNTLVLFFVIAVWLKDKWPAFKYQIYASVSVLCLLIGFSRIYLGVHFPTDLLGGWLIGGLILCGYFLLGDKKEALLEKGGFRAKMITSAVLSYIMIIYIPGRELVMPGGVILGLCIGYCLSDRYVGFASNAPFGKIGTEKNLALCTRLLIGIAGLALIFFAIGKLIPADSEDFKMYGFVQAALAGFWVSLAAPWVFVKLRLAGTKQDEQ